MINVLKSIKQYPTHLLVGPLHNTISQVTQLLHTIFCAQTTCTQCTLFTQLIQKQHAHITWLTPHDTYTKDQIEIIFDLVRFVREPEDYFFFIIEKADVLNLASANQLLKLLEEPPSGYRFILLTETIDRILPTIRSRCLVHYNSQQTEIQHHELVNLLIQKANPLTWLNTLESLHITPQECLLIINQALEQCIKQFEKKRDPVFEKRIAILTKALEYPPMPGSAKIYIKNVFLQLLRL